VRLGERGPAKGDAWLPADQDDPVPVTLFAQGYGSVPPGQGAAHDHDSGPAGLLTHVRRLPAPVRMEPRCPGWPGSAGDSLAGVRAIHPGVPGPDIPGPDVGNRTEGSPAPVVDRREHIPGDPHSRSR